MAIDRRLCQAGQIEPAVGGGRVASMPGLEEEFREFVAARSGALLRTAYLLAGDWASAEDLLQTTLTKTYLAWKRLGAIEAVEPYARRVLVNTATSWRRRRWHGERPTEVMPERAGPDQLAEAVERDLLWRHVRALPHRQRAVLVLRFYEDLSEAQTAELLDISPGTVKSQTSRALATLRKRLHAEGMVQVGIASAGGAGTGGAGTGGAGAPRPEASPAAVPQPEAVPPPAAPGVAVPSGVPLSPVPRPAVPVRPDHRTALDRAVP